MNFFFFPPVFVEERHNKCPCCNGKGYIKSLSVPINKDMEWSPVRFICEHCNGTGSSI